MADPGLTTTQLICLGVGLVLVLYPILSYTSEETAVRDWIENTWVLLDDAEKSISVRADAFLIRILNLVVSVLSTVYGDTVLSWRALAASASLCAATAAYLQAISQEYSSVYTFCLVIAQSLAWRWGQLRLALYAFLVFETAYTSYHIVDSLRDFHDGLAGGDSGLSGLAAAVFVAMPFSFVISVVVDYIAVCVVRWNFAAAQRSRGLRGRLLRVGLATLVAPALLASLLLCVEAAKPTFERLETDSTVIEMLGGILSAAAILTSCSFILVLVILVGLRTILALVPRAVYSLTKVDIDVHRRSALTFGLLLIGISLPEVSEVLEKILKGLFE